MLPTLLKSPPKLNSMHGMHSNWLLSLCLILICRHNVINRRLTFNQFFELLVPHLQPIFPSVRLAMNTGGMPVTEVPDMDILDHDVWAFLATLSVASVTEQQHILVTSLRDRILESVTSAIKGWSIPNEEVRKMRLANVNLVLHALGIDSSQITI